METDKFTHNMQGRIIGELTYEDPHEYTFVYADNRRNTFRNIMGFNVMDTGCYILSDKDGTVFVVRPLHEYLIQKTQEVADESS